ncbi:MAG: MBL fold metallo-hydrolase [Cryobacterium sp.]|jgi:L-ascorbate metabolism protein UlaG (beta-lactamase superfamily)|nr:MBL fold metallo-hydrolase [Cryobacterium sp.]
MKVTKQEHACFLVENAGKTLVVDPGSFTTLLIGLSDVVGIVITHEHQDHWTSDQLERILDRNPGARIFGPAGVAAAASEFSIEVVKSGETISVEPFALRFFGGQHAVIHSSIPVVDNLGVLINDELYYAGDSFTIPRGVEVGTLAAPAGAPWLKIGEVMDYVSAVAPKRSFPVHEMVLSTAGKTMSNARIQAATEAGGGEFFPLEPGESLDL